MVIHHERLALVLDWDGTVTELDTLHMVIERFGDLDVFDALEEEIGEAADPRRGDRARDGDDHGPARRGRRLAARATVRVRPGFRELVEEHDPLIVSAGFHELIDPMLRREGVGARVVANHVAADAARLALASFAVGPDLRRVRRALQARCGGGRSVAFAFVGDGVSDRCVALAAKRGFARAGLAAWLDEQGVAYEPFDDLFDVAAALAPAS